MHAGGILAAERRRRPGTAASRAPAGPAPAGSPLVPPASAAYSSASLPPVRRAPREVGVDDDDVRIHLPQPVDRRPEPAPLEAVQPRQVLERADHGHHRRRRRVLAQPCLDRVPRVPRQQDVHRQRPQGGEGDDEAGGREREDGRAAARQCQRRGPCRRRARARWPWAARSGRRDRGRRRRSTASRTTAGTSVASSSRFSRQRAAARTRPAAAAARAGAPSVKTSARTVAAASAARPPAERSNMRKSRLAEPMMSSTWAANPPGFSQMLSSTISPRAAVSAAAARRRSPRVARKEGGPPAARRWRCSAMTTNGAVRTNNPYAWSLVATAAAAHARQGDVVAQAMALQQPQVREQRGREPEQVRHVEVRELRVVGERRAEAGHEGGEQRGKVVEQLAAAEIDEDHGARGHQQADDAADPEQDVMPPRIRRRARATEHRRRPAPRGGRAGTSRATRWRSAARGPPARRPGSARPAPIRARWEGPSRAARRRSPRTAPPPPPAPPRGRRPCAASVDQLEHEIAVELGHLAAAGESGPSTQAGSSRSMRSHLLGPKPPRCTIT